MAEAASGAKRRKTRPDPYRYRCAIRDMDPELDQLVGQLDEQVDMAMGLVGSAGLIAGPLCDDGPLAGTQDGYCLAFLLTEAKIVAARMRRILDAVLDDKPLEEAG